MNTFLRSGESYFVSYRDPNLSDTLDVYDRIPEYIKNFSPDERDMTKYIIGTFSALDTPMNPEARVADHCLHISRVLPTSRFKRREMRY